MITRRGFLQTLGIATAAFTMDPEHLLWVPGAKTIFIPKDAGKVEVYDMDDVDFMVSILKANQIAFAHAYTDPEDVLRDSERLKINPFTLYNSAWTRHEVL